MNTIRYNTLSAWLLPALSGVLLIFSLPKPDLGILVWASLVPLLYFIRDKGPLTSVRAGFLAGFVFNLGGVYWLVETMSNYGGLPVVVSLLLLTALSAYMALYFAAFAGLLSYARGRAGIGQIALAAPLWVALELARNYLLSGFPWNLLGYSQAGLLPAIQVADITGVYGVSFLIVLINAAIADIIYATSNGARPNVRGLIAPAAAFIILLAALAYGGYRLSAPPATTGTIKVALAQGNIEQFHKWDPAYQDEVFGAYKELSKKALADRPDIIIWPETATPFIFQDTVRRQELAALVRGLGVPLLTGSPSVEPIAAGGFIDHNSAYLIDTRGETAGRYDKMHLVPFGEYVPLKKLLPFVSKMVEGIGDFGAGTEYTVLDSGKGRFGVAICFESIFPELVRRFADGGAEFLVVITNDAWFGSSSAPYQHFNMAVLRAVENRRALVRAANTGISGVITQEGRVKEQTAIFTRGDLVADVPLITKKSFYTRYGDLFAYSCVLASGFMLGGAFLNRRKK